MSKKHGDYKRMSDEDKAAWEKLMWGFPEPKMINMAFDKTKNAAVIGYWRNGMTHDEIRLATDLTKEQIDYIIWNYLNSKK